jgi:dihydroorotate dehydrogenase
VGLPVPVLRAGYERLIRPALFASYGGDPERIHEHMIDVLSGLGSTGPLRTLTRLLADSVGRPTRVAGIAFPSRVGLAAGLDKDASAVLAWRGLGFGFAEVGTVTAQGQSGNDRPRVFRLQASGAVINRMGFNNPGAAVVAATLAARGVYRGNGKAGLPVGISIGKTKVVPVEDAVTDYLSSLRTLAPHADYVAVNVSSPNTPGLRSLQDGGALAGLVAALVTQAQELAGPDGTPVPIFVKMAPDLTNDQLDEVVAVCSEAGAAGLIATNTTLARTGLAPRDRPLADQAGGLSGAPLTRRALEVVAHLTKQTDLPVIGCGGIMAPDHALAMFDAGAALVQLYTGFLYRGPALAAAIKARDLDRLRP